MRVIQHSAYQSSRSRLRAELDNHRPGHMVFIIGPSGVGKTTLRHSVMQEMFGQPARWGRGRTPVVETFALLSKNAYFSSLELAKALVDELHAPKLDWLLRESNLPKLDIELIRKELRACEMAWAELRPRRGTEGDYWSLFQRGLRARECKYVSIDQVTALLVNHRNKSPADHTLHLVSLAESAGVMFIMTGIHHASELWAVHPELRRRVSVVWVPPYGESRAGDIDNFHRLLRSMESKYSLSKQGLLMSMAFEILYATGGVFAELRQLLDRAKVKAEEDGCAKILKNHIESSFMSNRDLDCLWAQIRLFEAAMKSGDVLKEAERIRARWKGGRLVASSSDNGTNLPSGITAQ